MFLGMFLGICSAEYQREDPKNPHYSPTPPDPIPRTLSLPTLNFSSSAPHSYATPYHTPSNPIPACALSPSPSHLISSDLNKTIQNKTKQCELYAQEIAKAL